MCGYQSKDGSTMTTDQEKRDDLNWGDDPRLFERFTRWWQLLTQVSFMPYWDTFASSSIELFPPGGYYSFTLPWGKKSVQYWKPETEEGPKFQQKVYRVVNIRAGWLWMPILAIVHWQGWPWWAWIVGFLLGTFFNWRRDKNSGESYWTLSFNIDHESMRW